VAVVELAKENNWYNTPERKEKIDRFLKKRYQRKWGRTVKYQCRKNLAENRERVKGRFVPKK
jgi:hypothetical protein